MDMTSLIAQLLGGVAGGNAVGKGVPNVDLGPMGNSLAGAIGGQLVGGGASGAILTVVVGLIKNAMAGKTA